MSGQWIEVCGIPYFLPDNSPDLDELESSDEVQETESNSNSDYRFLDLVIKVSPTLILSRIETEYDEF